MSEAVVADGGGSLGIPASGGRCGPALAPLDGARIVILSGSHLCHNPRVMKEASALAAARCRVTVLGAWSDPELKQRDQALIGKLGFEFFPVVDLTGGGGARQLRRIRRKVAETIGRVEIWENRWQLGYVYADLREAAFRTDADLYIAHSEQALGVASDLLRGGRRVAVDMEDWFSEDLLPEARRTRPLHLLRRLEGELLRHGAYSSCPSAAMRDALVATYGCPPPHVIYNAFPWTERVVLDGPAPDRAERAHPSIHWFSQTIGAGRGLEDLLAALPLLKYPAHVHLRGNPVAGFADWLAQHTPEGWRERISVHGILPNAELQLRIAEHDIGFAGEMKHSASRDLTVTNKILQYLLAGLAVVASDTEGQGEVAAQAAEGVSIYPSGDPIALAAQLDALLGSPERLARAKAAALAAAERAFCWERQEPTLLDAISRSLSGVARQPTRSAPSWRL